MTAEEIFLSAVAALCLLLALWRWLWGLRRQRVFRRANIDSLSGPEFELLVAMLLTRQGFKVTNTPVSADFGADLFAADGRGQVTVVQCKRYGPGKKVDRTAASDAFGAAAYYRRRHGMNCTGWMVVTNRHYTRHAKDFADAIGCRLVDRNELVGWVVKYRER